MHLFNAPLLNLLSLLSGQFHLGYSTDCSLKLKLPIILGGASCVPSIVSEAGSMFVDVSISSCLGFRSRSCLALHTCFPEDQTLGLQTSPNASAR